MAAFLRLWANRGSVLEQLSRELEDADAVRQSETASAVRLQRVFRGQRVRAELTAKKGAATELQRVFRGFVGRAQAAAAAASRGRQQELAVFHYHALVIQKHFRGFYSRRYFHDYHARKAYIDSILTKSNALRAELAETLAAQQAEEEEARIREAQAEFQTVTENLHHLVSTKSCPGIYASPYHAEHAPTVFGRPVEEHLRHGVKDLLRTRNVEAETARRVAEMNARPHSLLSVQAATPFEATEAQKRIDAKYQKLLNVDQRNFTAGSASTEPPHSAGLHSGTPYVDAWKTGFNAGRGTKAARGRPPFYTAAGGNKSNIFANDLFDVMMRSRQMAGTMR